MFYNNWNQTSVSHLTVVDAVDNEQAAMHEPDDNSDCLPKSSNL